MDKMEFFWTGEIEEKLIELWQQNAFCTTFPAKPSLQ